MIASGPVTPLFRFMTGFLVMMMGVAEICLGVFAGAFRTSAGWQVLASLLLLDGSAKWIYMATRAIDYGLKGPDPAGPCE